MITARDAGGPRVWMIVPASPERFDGVRDFAHHLAAALSTGDAVRSVTTRDDGHPFPGTVTLPAWNSLDATAGWPHAIYVNYLPQSWLRRDTPALLARLSRARAAGTRVVLIIHEYQLDPGPSLARRAARVVFRSMARAFAARSDVVVTTHGFVAGLARADRLDAGRPVVTIPVGSNIAAAPEIETGTSRGIVMFGQPAGMAPAMVAAAAGAAEAHGTTLTWICRREPETREWLARHAVDSGPLRIAAGMNESAVSSALASAAIGFAPNDDGVSTRRTTVAALLQHGLPVVGTDGRTTDPVLRDSGAFLLAPIGEPAQARAYIERLLGDAAARARLGAAARALFDAHLSWPRIADEYRRLVA